MSAKSSKKKKSKKKKSKKKKPTTTYENFSFGKKEIKDLWNNSKSIITHQSSEKALETMFRKFADAYNIRPNSSDCAKAVKDAIAHLKQAVCIKLVDPNELSDNRDIFNTLVQTNKPDQILINNNFFGQYIVTVDSEKKRKNQMLRDCEIVS